MDRQIEVRVSGNYITKDNSIAGVRGEANVTGLRLIFDDEWSSYAKEVTFWDALGENPIKVLLGFSNQESIDNDYIYVIPIPAEPLAKGGMMTFVIDGHIDDRRKRSVSDTLKVKDSPDSDNAGDPIEPTPDVIEQFQEDIEYIRANIQEAVEAAQSVREAADNGVFDGEKGDQGEKGEKGDKGETGEQGPPGEQGVPGKIEDISKTEYAIAPNVTEFNYYNSLNDCISDINGNVTTHSVDKSTYNECCTYVNSEGVATIILLNNISTTTGYQPFTVPVVLNLAGRTIHCDRSSAASGGSLFYFAKSFKIDATLGGKMIVTGSNVGGYICWSQTTDSAEVYGGEYEISNVSGGTTRCFYFQNDAKHTIIKGAKLLINTTATSDAFGIYAKEAITVDNCEITIHSNGNAKGIYIAPITKPAHIRNCNIYVEGYDWAVGVDIRGADSGDIANDAVVYCLNTTVRTNITFGIPTTFIDPDEKSMCSFGCYATRLNKVHFKDCYAYADAADDSVTHTIDDAESSTPYSDGILINSGNFAEIDACYAYGTHAGIDMNAIESIIVNTQTYSCSHGGVYWGGQNSINYIRDSILGCKAYDGVHNFSEMDNHTFLANFYIGGHTEATNIKVYMDNCTLPMEQSNSGGVVRYVNANADNRLYISNTDVPDIIKDNAIYGIRLDLGNSVIAGAGMEDLSEKVYYLVDGVRTSAADRLSTTPYVYSREAVNYNGLTPTVTPHATSGAIVVAANTYTTIPELTGATTITLGDSVVGCFNEWVFTIKQGETAQTLELPTIVWDRGYVPTFEANTVTEVRLWYSNDILKGVWL